MAMKNSKKLFFGVLVILSPGTLFAGSSFNMLNKQILFHHFISAVSLIFPFILLVELFERGSELRISLLRQAHFFTTSK